MAKSAQSAIRTLDEHGADIIVMELQLVGHNGIEFLYELRSYADWQSLPVVLLTLQNPEIMNNKVLAEHIKIARFLHKPRTDVKDILQSVAELALQPT